MASASVGISIAELMAFSVRVKRMGDRTEAIERAVGLRFGESDTVQMAVRGRFQVGVGRKPFETMLLAPRFFGGLARHLKTGPATISRGRRSAKAQMWGCPPKKSSRRPFLWHKFSTVKKMLLACEMEP